MPGTGEATPPKQAEVSGSKNTANTAQRAEVSPSPKRPGGPIANRETPIVGGEIITPTAVRVDDPRNPDGSVNFKPAQERGWLAAITTANGKEDIPDEKKLENVEEIVRAAVDAGVPREKIRGQLDSLDLQDVEIPETETQATTKPKETVKVTTITKKIEAPPPPKGPENIARIESLDSHDDVEDALYHTLQVLEKTPDAELSKDEQWAKKAIRSSIAKSLDRGRDTVRVDFDKEGAAYRPFSEEEGIPVDTLISFIKDRVSDMKDTPERENLRQKILILERNSKNFYDIDPERRYDPAQMVARIEHEAYLVSQDVRNEGSELENYIKARKILGKARRELFFPSKVAKPAPAAKVETVTPAAEPPKEVPKEKTIEATPKAAVGTDKVNEVTPPPVDETATKEPKGDDETAGKEPKSIREMRIDNYIVSLQKSLTGFGRVEGWERARKGMQRGSWKNPLNWPRKIGLRMVQEFFQDNERIRVQKAMLDNDTTMLTMDMAKTAAGIASAKEQGRAVQEATIKRFEEGNLLPGEESAEEASESLNKLINNEILKPIVKGTITTPEQVRAKLAEFVKAHLDDPQVWKFFGADANNFGEVAEIFATSFLGTGLRMRTDVGNNDEAIEQMVQLVHNKLAVSKAGPQTEKMNLTEKARAWANKKRSQTLAQGAQLVGLRGLILNPFVVGAGVTLGTTSLLRAAGIAGRIAAVPSFLVGGVSGGAFAGARKYYELSTLDRPMQAIQKTVGEYKKRQQESPRRDKLEEFNYNMANSNELRNGGGIELISQRTRRSGEELLALDLNAGTPEEKQRNIEDIARRKTEILVRYGLSVALHKDFVGFESRLQSEIAPADDIALSAKLHEKLMEHYRQIEKDAGTANDQLEKKAGENEENLLNRFITEWNNALITNVRDQDAAFKSHALKEALKAGTFAGIIGGGAVIAFQEAWAGAARGIFHQNVGQTLAESWAGYNPEAPITPTGVPTAGSIEAFRNIYDHGGSTNIGDHFRATVNPDHSLSIIDTRTNQPLPDSTHFSVDSQNHIKVTGDIPQGLRTELEGKGYQIAVGPDIIEQGPPQTVEKHLFGPDGEWTNHATNIDHREWYAYDQPGSQGNELRGYNSYGSNSATFDMSHMEQGFQHGLNPNPIDVQEVIKNGQAGIYVSTGDHQSGGLWIPDSADGKIDGKVTLTLGDTHTFDTPGGQMTNDEAYKMIVNQDAVGNGGTATELNNRPDIWALNHGGQGGFIEYGRMTNVDGKDVLQTFATIHGTGAAHETITTIIPGEPKPPIRTFDVIPPESGPGEAGEGSDAPLIPFVFWPRQPLEDLGKPAVPEPPITPVPPVVPPPIFGPEVLPPVMGYYGGRDLESMQKWITEHPERLHPYKKIKDADGKDVWVDSEGKPVIRDISKEREAIEKYFEEMRTSTPEYVNYLGKLLNQPTMSPMASQNKVSINIPAWMEGKNIYRLLEEYTQQVDRSGKALSPDLFEINIIVNRKTGAPSDNTVLEIKRFLDTHKGYKINFLDVEFDPPFNNVGNARKVITDLTLMRSTQRPSQEGSLYIESEDADLLHVDSKTVINLIDKLDQNPHLDAALGIQDRFPEELMKNDLLFLRRRLWDYTLPIMQARKFRPENNPNWSFTWNRVVTGGWNTGFTAQAYAQIGGYSNREMGEDMEIGEKMTMARGDGSIPNLDIVGRVGTRSDSSPRRFIAELLTGKGAYSETFSDEKMNDFIKNASLEDLQKKISPYARINPTNRNVFEQAFQGQLELVRSFAPSENEARKTFDTVLFWSGFKKGDYDYTPDGHLVIKNLANVQKALEDYRRRHIAPRKPGERTGHRTKGPAIRTVRKVPEPAEPPRGIVVGEKVIHHGDTYKVVRVDEKKDRVTLEGKIDGKAKVRTTRSKADIERELATPESSWKREIPLPKVERPATKKFHAEIPATGEEKRRFPKIGMPKVHIPRPSIERVGAAGRGVAKRAEELRAGVSRARLPEVKLPKPTIKIPRVPRPKIGRPKINIRRPHIEVPTVKLPEFKVGKPRLPKGPSLPKIRVPRPHLPKISRAEAPAEILSPKPSYRILTGMGFTQDEMNGLNRDVKRFLDKQGSETVLIELMSELPKIPTIKGPLSPSEKKLKKLGFKPEAIAKMIKEKEKLNDVVVNVAIQKLMYANKDMTEEQARNAILNLKG